jgi:hypothetical protein
MIAPKTYFLTADRSKAVPEGHKSAQFLLVRAGQEISEADWEKYGLNVASGDDQADSKKPAPIKK